VVKFLEARVNFARGNWDKVISLYKTLGARSGWYQRDFSSYLIAQFYFEKGVFEEAIREVQNAQNYYGEFHAHIYPNSFYLLGKIYDKKGDPQRAIQNYEKFLDLWKDADEDPPDLIDAKKEVGKTQGNVKQGKLTDLVFRLPRPKVSRVRPPSFAQRVV